MRGLREDRLGVAPPEDLPDLRRHALLRLVAEPAREQAREVLRPPRHLLRRARRELALLLSGRRVRGILMDRVHVPQGREDSAFVKAHRDELFPVLTEAQVARIAPFGKERRFADGENLWETGDRGISFFVVLEGE